MQSNLQETCLKRGNRIGVRCVKYDIQGVFLKCAKILPTEL
jgi:hypothetical protein